MTNLQPWARLVRLPNLPTAMADIALAALATDSLPQRWPGFVLLLLCSSCLYLSGMVWNDFFDVEQDRRERPDRPIPSGQISRRAAGLLASGLMVTGVVLAYLAGSISRDESTSGQLPLLFALLLVAAILLYDGWWKRTVLGPVSMGLCRFLNVMLGVSLTGTLAWPLGPHLALVVGLYIVGVTWFARTEAGTSQQTALVSAAGVMLLSLLLALPVPVHRPVDTASILFPYLLVGLAFWLGWAIWRAVQHPTAENVQSGVKRSLIGLILLDTVLATATAGTFGLILLLLLGPSLYLNRRRWLYAT